MVKTAMDLVAEAKQAIAEVDVENAKALLGTAIVLDVREPAEFAAGCLPGAVNIPRGVLEFKIGEHPAFKGRQNDQILVYCQTGGRSALATAALTILGYTRAVSLAGGFNSWQQQGGNISPGA